MKKKLLFYTDCPFFGGCENILLNLINSEKISINYEIQLIYRYSEIYNNEIQNKFNKSVKLIPAYLLTNDSEIYKKLVTIDKNRMKIINLLFRIFAKIMRMTKNSGIYSLYNFVILFFLIKKFSPDLIHINNGGYPAAFTCRVAVFSAKLANITKIVFTVNNLAMPQKNFLDSYIDILINSWVSFFTTASKAAKNRLISERKFSKHKVINIANTIYNDSNIIIEKGDLRKKFNISDDTLIIGSFGLLIERKGYDILIEAINNIKDKLKDQKALFFIFGEGEKRLTLESMIKKYSLDNIVFLPGHEKEPLKYLIDFDIFVLPSKDYEDFPYVIIEAMMLGKPIISTKVAGIPEQVEHNYNGYLVEPMDVLDLGNKILNLIIDKNKIKYLGVNSKIKYFELFSYKSVIDNYIKIYNV